MTSKYIFIGSRAELLGRYLFTEFGQEVDLDQAEAESLVMHQRFPLVPADTFEATKSAPDHPLAAREALQKYRTHLTEAADAAAEKTAAAEKATADKAEAAATAAAVPKKDAPAPPRITPAPAPAVVATKDHQEFSK